MKQLKLINETQLIEYAIAGVDADIDYVSRHQSAENEDLYIKLCDIHHELSEYLIELRNKK